MKKKKTLRNTIFCSAAALLLVASLTACGNQDDTSSVVSEESAPSSVAEVKYENINPLTGENNLATSAKGQRPIAFMVNNNPKARPHWGLCSADIVIEGRKPILLFLQMVWMSLTVLATKAHIFSVIKPEMFP